MNSRTTLWLTGLALGLFGYIYFVEMRQPGSGPNTQPLGQLLPDFDPGAVTGVEVTRSNQTIRVELASRQWQLNSPRYPAQTTAIESFLVALAKLNRQREISAQEIISQSGGLSPFGLDPPSAVIRLQAGTNVIQFRVGSKTLLGDSVYVQPIGASGVFTTDASFLKHLPATAAVWRDPMFLPQNSLVFDRIQIVAGSRPLKLERDRTTQLWRLVEPMPTRADFERVEYLVQQLRTARVAEFVTDNPKEDLEPYGLQTPESYLTLAFGTNAVFQVQFGKSPVGDPSQVYARRLSHTNVVLVSRELADLVGKNYMDYRDRSLISFRPNLVDRIEVRADEAFAVQRQSSNEWQIVSPFQARADRQEMQLFLEDLAKVEIARFEKDVVADFTPYGLSAPSRQYILKSALTNPSGPTNQVLVQVDFGNFPTNEIHNVYSRRSDESSDYVVAFSDVFRLARAAFALRDRRIWDFASSNVTSVTVSQRGKKRQLVRDPVTHKWDRENVPLDAGIEETLFRLGRFQAESWVARGTNQAERLGTAAGKYDLSFDLNEAGKQRRLALSFGKPASSGVPYAAVTLEQGEPILFKFPAQLYALVAEYLSVPQADAEP